MAVSSLKGEKQDQNVSTDRSVAIGRAESKRKGGYRENRSGYTVMRKDVSMSPRMIVRMLALTLQVVKRNEGDDLQTERNKIDQRPVKSREASIIFRIQVYR